MQTIKTDLTGLIKQITEDGFEIIKGYSRHALEYFKETGNGIANESWRFEDDHALHYTQGKWIPDVKAIFTEAR